MRDTGPVNKSLTGDPDLSAAQIATARTQLGILKNQMKLGSLPTGKRTVILEDGTTITVGSRYGIDTIAVDTTTVSVAGGPDEELPVETPISQPPPEQPVATVGIEAFYSAVYVSSILKGAVMDKTGTVVMLAYAAPDFDQMYTIYNPTGIANASLLMRLNSKLGEVGRNPVLMPDWAGQLAYDNMTDTFFLSVFNPLDVRFQTSATYTDGFYGNPQFCPHRSMLQIAKDGSQAEMPDVPIGSAGRNTVWGNSTWAEGLSGTLVDPQDSNNFTYFGLDEEYGIDPGSHRDCASFPLSQPSTSGLIAVMYPGYRSAKLGATAGPDDGYPFLWSTRTQSVVWSGAGLGTYKGAVGTRFDPWAVITPMGNAIFSIAGQPVMVSLGGAGISAPPAGTIDIAVTNGDKAAYAISESTLSIYSAAKGWVPFPLGAATPLAVLHDVVTDAVAVVMTNLSVWVFNGQSPSQGMLAPFSFQIPSPPTTVPGMVYPQQFMNGSLLVTYAVSGGAGTRTGTYVWLVYAVEGEYIPPAQWGSPYGMPATLFPGQRATAWRAQLGRVGGLDPMYAYDEPQSQYDGATTALPWVVGKYDVLALKQ